MQRVDHPTADPDANGSGVPGFTEGDPLIPTPATVVPAAWLNTVQEELALAIEAAGLTVNPADNTQLRQALNAFVDTYETPVVGRQVWIGPWSGLGLAAANAWFTTPGLEYVVTGVAAQSVPISLDPYVREGMTLTGIEAKVRPVQTGGSRGGPMRLTLFEIQHGSSSLAMATEPTSVELATGDDNGTTNTHGISLPLNNVVIRSERSYIARVIGGTNVAGDRIYGLRLAFTDPGPRNY